MPANLPAGATASAEFEFCELCRRNHDQGRRHRYFPAHRTALSAALTRFRAKLSDLRRAVLHGASSSQPPRPRLWCPFCSTDLVDLDSPSACSAIYHLASSEHLKGVKDFLRKHGGGMDQVASLRISEVELAKWEKGRGSSRTGAKKGTEELIGPTPGPMKDIRNESTSDNLDSLAQTDIPSFTNESASYVVMPLQSPTNGAYHPISTASYGASISGSASYSAAYGTLGLPNTPWGSANTQEQQGVLTTNWFHITDPEMQGHQNTIVRNAPIPSMSCLVHVQHNRSSSNMDNGSKANVHTGAPPPWLEASDHDPKGSSLSSRGLPSSGKGKSKKLNPKRVGAAWAERRRAEMEMEKRGEIVPDASDSSWLPNFGGVWQSGTRKESRKEFEKKHKLQYSESNDELSLEIKPYISKRMHAGSDKTEQPVGPVDP